MKIIGFAGPAGVGKSAAAAIISVKCKAKIIPYALPLKLAACEIFGISLDYFTSQKLKQQVHPLWGISPREMLQKLGTEGVRDVFGEDFWLRRMTVAMRGSSFVVIDDVRFDDEAEFVRSKGGALVHIKSDTFTSDLGSLSTHISERGVKLKTGDYVIHNDTDINTLKSAVISTISQHYR